MSVTLVAAAPTFPPASSVRHDCGAGSVPLAAFFTQAAFALPCAADSLTPAPLRPVRHLAWFDVWGGVVHPGTALCWHVRIPLQASTVQSSLSSLHEAPPGMELCRQVPVPSQYSIVQSRPSS